METLSIKIINRNVNILKNKYLMITEDKYG
jgi:hypothetical protein